MGWALETHGAAGFISLKVALVTLFMAILWRGRGETLSNYGLAGILGIYGVLAVYHLTPYLA